MPLTPDEQLAIRDLLARYNHAIDARDTAAWVDCFTDDAVYEFPPAPPVSGREQLRRVAERRRDVPSSPPSRHWLSSARIEGDGDTATVTCYIALLRPEQPPRINHTGVYTLSLRKVDGGWKFARRTMVRDQPLAR